LSGWAPRHRRIISPIADGLGIAKADAGVVLTTYALAYALLSPITGRHRHSRRRVVLVMALAIFAVGTSLPLFPPISSCWRPRVSWWRWAAPCMGRSRPVSRLPSATPERGQGPGDGVIGGTIAQVVGMPFGAWVSYHSDGPRPSGSWRPWQPQGRA